MGPFKAGCRVLEEKNKWIRAEYAEMLGDCNKKEEVKRVLKEVLDDEQVEVRLKAASSLAKHGDVSGHRVALEAMEDVRERRSGGFRAVDVPTEI